MTYEEIEDAAMELPDEDRLRLGANLALSTECEEITEGEWEVELADRIEDIQSGRDVLIPGDEVRENIRRLMAQLNKERNARDAADCLPPAGTARVSQASAVLR